MNSEGEIDGNLLISGKCFHFKHIEFTMQVWREMKVPSYRKTSRKFQRVSMTQEFKSTLKKPNSEELKVGT